MFGGGADSRHRVAVEQRGKKGAGPGKGVGDHAVRTRTNGRGKATA